MQDKFKNLKKTPFHQIHRDAGARMVSFGGWEMPVQYSGIVEEHKTVREHAGLFDVSHMGQIDIKGKGAISFLHKLLVGDIANLHDGKVLYSLMCLPTGGIIDDLLVYKFTDSYFMLCVNASNTEKDYDWIQKQSEGFEVDLKNTSAETAMLALQGKNAEAILQKICSPDITSLQYYEFTTGTVAGVLASVSRTGYTGEDGFEIYFDSGSSDQMWTAIMEEGKAYGLKPIGLAARDTLRLEMKYTLYGNDISESTTPIEAGLSWAIGFDKEDFIGRKVLLKQKQDGPKKKLVAFEMTEKGIPRSHYKLYSIDNELIGEVTSGTHSPTLQKGIGIGYLDTAYSKPGTNIFVEVRGKKIKATTVRPPFYKGNVKKK